MAAISPVRRVPRPARLARRHGPGRGVGVPKRRHAGALLDRDNRVHLRNMTIARGFGTSVELRQGLRGGERVVLDLPADVGDGGRVKPIQPNTQQGRPRQQPNPGHREPRTAPEQRLGRELASYELCDGEAGV
jgi:hypothetical protein